jgi:protoheme IX farnesyltransferase
MKTEELSSCTCSAPATSAGAGNWRDYLELTKPRLSFFSVFTAVASYLAADTGFSLTGLILLTVGVSLAAGGAGALNQWWEIDVDSRMRRTSDRPLPQHRLSPAQGFWFGMTLSVAGPLILWASVGLLPASLTVLTLVTYVVWYTPMKRKTHWATEIGALPGALPPLVGWTAATGELSAFGWVLFAMLFCWQIPHFLAIAWMYRWDYALGGMPVRTLRDSTGREAALSALVATVILIGVSLMGWIMGATGLGFAICAVSVSVWFTVKAWNFFRSETPDADARSLFWASLIYLPVWFIPLLVDRLIF